MSGLWGEGAKLFMYVTSPEEYIQTLLWSGTCFQNR